MRRILGLLVLLIPLAAHAEPAQEQWFSVLLDGRKIGSFESTREVREEKVTTRQRLDIDLERAGTKISMSSTETSEETVDGKPLAFTSTSQLSGSETRVEGRVEGTRVHVRLRNAGDWQEREIAWPTGALLPEGLRLASLHVPLEKGRKYQEISFQPSSLDAITVTSTIGALESVNLPSGRRQLHKIEQSFEFPGAPMRNTAWIDEERDLRKLTMPMLGVELTLVECDKPCATAPNQPSDVFERTLMPAPRALSRAELGTGLRYTLTARDRGKPLHLPETSEQSVRSNGTDLIVEVRKSTHGDKRNPPEPADYAANDWLQSTAPEVLELARRAAGDLKDDAERMQALETFVRGFITNKNLGVGYASALEVARKPEGDCTEHAVLLAALGRALGIATRVVDGLAYTQGFAGAKNVFVPHAWAQAWVDGRWQSYDAALAGFDAGHIAFSAGDGDPWRFYQGLDLLGRIEVKRIDSLHDVAKK
jgi:hypothetical protein